MARILNWVLIANGIFLLGDAAWDAHRGVAEAVSPSRMISHGSVSQVVKASRAEQPRDFANLMFYQWARAGVFLGAGLLIRGLWRRAEKSDPFSPDFVGQRSLDKLGEALMKEEERRHRPLR